MGGKGSGGGSNWKLVPNTGGGKSTNPYAGGNKNVGYWNPGGGKVPSYDKGGSQNDKAPRTYSAGGGKKRSSAIKPQHTAAAKEIAKNAAIGALLAGVPGALVGGAYGAYRGGGTKGGAGELAVDIRKGAPSRASMKGVAARNTYPSMSRFGPQDLLTGGSVGPMSPSRGSLLGGDTEDTLSEVDTWF